LAWISSKVYTRHFLTLLSPEPGDRILDVGAGKGAVARYVLSTSKGTKVFAIDPDERRVAAIGHDTPDLTSYAAGAENIPFPDSFFDKAYTTMAIHHFSDLDKGLREIARVLKQDGSLVILETDPRRGWGRVCRFFENGILRRRHVFLEQDQLAGRLEAMGSFKLLQSIGVKSSYFIHCVKC
jgi:ubiquinone/menaquinone biosynthesis C-methylase UbiE